MISSHIKDDKAVIGERQRSMSDPVIKVFIDSILSSCHSIQSLKEKMAMNILFPNELSMKKGRHYLRIEFNKSAFFYFC